MDPLKALAGNLCAMCGTPKMIRPDNGLLCSECERKSNEQFATKIRPDMAKKGKIEIKWKPGEE
jgi:hypothetical protein